MELFDLSQLHTLIAYLHDHPYIGGLITFGIAFVESIALIGGLIPGSVTMTAIGALIGSGAMPMLATLSWAVAGAFVGDFLSYGIGAYYNERLRGMWPFRKHPQWLAMGQDFFKKHGGKSVLIGRFFGPVRSLVPLIAGLLHLSIPRFAISAFFAAVLWSLVYIVPGIVVGALSLELPPAVATKFILIVLAVVAFGWIVFVLLHLGFKTMVAWADRVMDYFWQFLEKHPTTSWLARFISDPNKPNPHRQLTLALFALLTVLLFLATFYSMVTHGHLTHLNEPVFELLRSLRTRVGDDIMLVVTIVGSKEVQLVSGVLIFAWLFWQRYHRAAWHWLGVIVLSAGSAQLVKLLYYSPRPTGLLNPQLTSSFPSGHAILATALFGFLAMLLAHHLPASRRKMPFGIAGFFILLVVTSRLYLGAHWLLDVIASLFLGASCAALMNLSYLRRESRPLPVAKVSKVAIGIFLGIGFVFGVAQFHTQQQNYTLYWPETTMSSEAWWQSPQPEEPLFILSRLGRPEAVLNVQWLSSLENIRQILIAKGWQEHAVHLNWKGSLNRLSAKANPQHLPVWPSLYQNKSPVLLLTKQQNGQPPLYFVLWKSNINLLDTAQTLWVGSVHYFVPRPKKNALSLTPEQIQQLYKAAMQVFVADVQQTGLRQQIRRIPLQEQPTVMQPLHWDGKLLLVR